MTVRRMTPLNSRPTAQTMSRGYLRGTPDSLGTKNRLTPVMNNPSQPISWAWPCAWRVGVHQSPTDQPRPAWRARRAANPNPTVSAVSVDPNTAR